MTVATPTLTEAYYPADTSEPILDTTVGGILRDAARPGRTTPRSSAGTPIPQQRRRWTYGELLDDAERCARALLGRFEPGERVAVWAPNIPEWEVVEFGAALAGLILVTVNPAYKPGELKYVLEQSGASGIFLLPEFRGNPMAQSLETVRGDLPGLREAIAFTEFDAFLASGAPTEQLPDVGPDDPVQIQYTSGTTGFPKGALLHHRGLTNNARLTLGLCGFSPGRRLREPVPAVPHRRVRARRAGLRLAPAHARPRPGVRARPDARPHRDRARGRDGRRLDRPDRADRGSRASRRATCRRCAWRSPAARSWRPSWSSRSRTASACASRSSTGRPKLAGDHPGPARRRLRGSRHDDRPPAARRPRSGSSTRRPARPCRAASSASCARAATT